MQEETTSIRTNLGPECVIFILLVLIEYDLVDLLFSQLLSLEQE